MSNNTNMKYNIAVYKTVWNRIRRPRTRTNMKLQQLSDLILSLPWKTVADTSVVVEMPDDQTRYALNGVHFDSETNTVVLEIA